MFIHSKCLIDERDNQPEYRIIIPTIENLDAHSVNKSFCLNSDTDSEVDQ